MLRITQILVHLDEEEEQEEIDNDEEEDGQVEEDQDIEDERGAGVPNRENIIQVARANRLRRRQLTSQRLVHSIDSAIDLNNYNPFELPNEHKTIEGIVKVDRNKNNDIHYKFDNRPTTTHVGRNNRANVIRGRQGVAPVAKDTRDNREVFEHFINGDMIYKLVTYTNQNIDKLISELPDDFDRIKNPFVRTTVPSEITAFIELFIYRGLYKLNTISITKLFSTKYGPPIFSATMSRSRFTFLLANLPFDDQTTRDERWNIIYLFIYSFL